MKRVLIPLALAIALTSAVAPAFAQTPGGKEPGKDASVEATDDSTWTDADDRDHDDRVAIGSSVDVPAGKVHSGDVISVGGHATIDGEVTGDVIVVAGTLEVGGTIHGDTICVGSSVVLKPGSVLEQQFIDVLNTIDKDEARIVGQRVDVPFGMHLPGMKSPLGLIGAILWWLTVASLVLLFLSLFFFAALVPERVRILSEETPQSLLWAFLVGLLVYVVVFVLKFLLAVTFIGIPFAICLHLAFVALKWLGMAGMFHYVGKRFGRLAGRDLSMPAALLLGFLPVALLSLMPFLVGGLVGFLLLLTVHFVLWVFVEAPAVGLVFLTRAGGRPRRAPPAPPVHAAAPTSVVIPPPEP
jgi:hypothetical protein